jgi:TonB family protein
MAGRFIFCCALGLGLVVLAHEKATASVFCDADISDFENVDTPLSASPRMQQPRAAFVLESNTPSRLSGDVIVVTHDAAYDVKFSNLETQKDPPGERGVTSPILVTFPKPLAIEFAWVDQIGSDGAAPHSCPTEPFGTVLSNAPNHGVKLPARIYSLGGFHVVPAVFKMNLPPLSCADVYHPAQIVDWGNQETEFFDTSQGLHAAATVRVFVDSEGKAADVKVAQSSGSAIVDGAAVEKAAKARYSPAMFRCTPVVGSLMIDVNYEVGH